MPPILNDLLDSVNNFLSERVGLYFKQIRFADLACGLHKAAAELGYEDTRVCIENMLAHKFNKSDLQIVVRNLTVGETYFFRDPDVFVALEEKVIPQTLKLKRGRKPLRIWSAGCSTGEEPYSIAISLLRTIPNLQTRELSLFATDINTRSLDKARDATYGSWSFRTMPEDFLKEYFEQGNNSGQYLLKQTIRHLVRFGYLNLAEDQYPSLQSDTAGMDIIFCRNVLIYFTQQKCKEIADKLSACLAPKGVLITSASDSARFITCPPQGLERASSTVFIKANGV